MTPRRRRQGGQAITELALSAVVLLLLVTGLLDFARVFYFTSALRGTAFAAARHAAWFDPGQRQNAYLDDADITTSVNEGLAGAHLPTVTGVQGTCPSPTDGNSQHNPPFNSSAYPTGVDQTYLYVCYTKPDGTVVGSMSSPPGPYVTTWHLGDVDVILLFNYGLITGFMQQQLQAAGGIHVATNAHFTVQGGP